MEKKWAVIFTLDENGVKIDQTTTQVDGLSKLGLIELLKQDILKRETNTSGS